MPAPISIHAPAVATRSSCRRFAGRKRRTRALGRATVPIRTGRSSWISGARTVGSSRDGSAQRSMRHFLMNYRHAFHAGNFADVVKHAILVRILVHLRAKPTPFRVIDTHAGAGLYDLASSEASRSEEWREGIARSSALPSRKRQKPCLRPISTPFLRSTSPATSSSIPVRRCSRARSCASRIGLSPVSSSRARRPRSQPIYGRQAQQGDGDRRLDCA